MDVFGLCDLSAVISEIAATKAKRHVDIHLVKIIKVEVQCRRAALKGDCHRPVVLVAARGSRNVNIAD